MYVAKELPSAGCCCDCPRGAASPSLCCTAEDKVWWFPRNTFWTERHRKTKRTTKQNIENYHLHPLFIISGISSPSQLLCHQLISEVQMRTKTGQNNKSTVSVRFWLEQKCDHQTKGLKILHSKTKSLSFFLSLLQSVVVLFSSFTRPQSHITFTINDFISKFHAVLALLQFYTFLLLLPLLHLPLNIRLFSTDQCH